MNKFDKFITTFLTEDYFLIFMAIIFIILVVLIIAFIKTRHDYLSISEEKDFYFSDKDDDILNLIKFNESIEKTEIEEKEKARDNIKLSEELISKVPVVIPEIKTYDKIINEYESMEEENAIISTEELERKTKERMEALGLSENEAMIKKYEEEQERKAIISYEQLLKNASNISVSYHEEKRASDDAPIVNKIEVLDREIVPAQNYFEEEEFIKLMKEFRMALE